MTLTKSVVALLLFGGVTKILRDGSVIRGDINALVVSDPGMGKTILLKYAARVAPRGIFANATTSTKVGLVASVQKDENTGNWAIEAGAYMLASGGVFCLDEMSELTKEDTKMLNECMENGEAHINKAGINATVKTKAAMLAACNPKDGRFINGDVALQDQVNIDASVLSRFDVVVLLQDFASSEKDEKTADYILQNHMDSLLSVTNAEEITPDLMRKYISYARRINPVLTPEANTAIKQFYVKTRPGGENGNTIAITTRQVPALIRMAEAHARIRLSDKVTKEDAELAIEILNMSLNAVAIDPVTGQIDEDRIGNKSCKQSRGFRDDLIKVIHQMAEGTGYAKTELISGGMSLKGYPIDKIPHTLEMLAREGVLIQVKNGLWRVMT